MVTWRDFEVKQEQHRDALREAEKQRLIKLATATDCDESQLKQVLKSLFAKGQASQNDTPCGGQRQFADKAA